MIEDVEPEFQILDGINNDLERVVRKALEKDPARRYQSVSALAEDLRRYLAGEPVEAGVGANAYLLRKTIRRFRVHLSVAAVLVLILVGSLVAVTRAYRQTRGVLQVAQTGLQMGAFVRAGRVYRDQGRIDDALRMLEASVELGRMLPPTDPLLRYQLFNTHFTLTELHFDYVDPKKGQEHREIAERLAEVLLADDPNNLEVRRQVAFCSYLAGKVLLISGDNSSALRELDDAEHRLRGLLATSEDKERLKYDLAALVLRKKAQCLRKLNQETASRGAFEAARLLLMELNDEVPDHAEYIIELAHAEADLAFWHLRQHEPENYLESQQLFSQAESRLLSVEHSSAATSLGKDFKDLFNSIQSNLRYVTKRLPADRKPLPE
jgi:serine/threonine-protein kinase